MNHLNTNTNKLILLVLVSVVLLLLLNFNQSVFGRDVSAIGTLIVIVAAVYLGNNLMNRQDEAEEEEEVRVNANNAPVNNLSVNNAPVNNVPVNNAPVNNVVNAANFEDDVNVEHIVEGFQNNVANNGANNGANNSANNVGVSAHDMTNSMPGSVNYGSNSGSNNNCLPRDVLNPEELLPASQSPNNWDTPANPGGIDGPNFLNPEHLVGINTVGQSLRNANRQIRSEPPNPQVKVSPWLQTTIEPDTNRLPLEIGGC